MLRAVRPRGAAGREARRGRAKTSPPPFPNVGFRSLHNPTESFRSVGFRNLHKPTELRGYRGGPVARIAGRQSACDNPPAGPECRGECREDKEHGMDDIRRSRSGFEYQAR